MSGTDYSHWGVPPVHQNPQSQYHPSLQLEHYDRVHGFLGDDRDDGRRYQPQPGSSASGSVPDRSAPSFNSTNTAAYTTPFSTNNFSFGQDNGSENVYNQFLGTNQTEFPENQFHSQFPNTAPHGIQQPPLFTGSFQQQARLDNNMELSVPFTSSPPLMSYHSSQIQPPMINTQNIVPSSSYPSKRHKGDDEAESDEEDPEDQQAEHEPEEQKRPSAIFLIIFFFL